MRTIRINPYDQFTQKFVQDPIEQKAKQRKTVSAYLHEREVL